MIVDLERELHLVVDAGLSFACALSLCDLVFVALLLVLVVLDGLTNSLINASNKQRSLVFICCELCQQILSLWLMQFLVELVFVDFHQGAARVAQESIQCGQVDLACGFLGGSGLPGSNRWCVLHWVCFLNVL